MSITWTGGAAPTGITSEYRIYQYGKKVTIWFRIVATGAGTAITAATFPLPADAPLPSTWPSQPNSQHISAGHGALSATANPTPSNNGSAFLTVDGSGNFLVQVSGASVAVKYVWAEISYIADS